MLKNFNCEKRRRIFTAILLCVCLGITGFAFGPDNAFVTMVFARESQVFEVEITSPVNNSAIYGGCVLTVEAEVIYEGSITKVEFYRDGVLEAVDTEYPYSCTLTNNVFGTFSLTAAVYSSDEESVASAPVSYTVSGGDGIYVDDNFDDYVNASTKPLNYDLVNSSGLVESAPSPEREGRSVKLSSTAGAGAPYMDRLNIPKMSGKVVIETSVMTTTTVNEVTVISPTDINGLECSALLLFRENGQLGYLLEPGKKRDISPPIYYDANTWYDLIFTIDMENRSYNLSVNGTEILTNQKMPVSTVNEESFDYAHYKRFRIRQSNNATVASAFYVDYLKISPYPKDEMYYYAKDNFDDYVNSSTKPLNYDLVNSSGLVESAPSPEREGRSVKLSSTVGLGAPYMDRTNIPKMSNKIIIETSVMATTTVNEVVVMSPTDINGLECSAFLLFRENGQLGYLLEPGKKRDISPPIYYDENTWYDLVFTIDAENRSYNLSVNGTEILTNQKMPVATANEESFDYSHYRRFRIRQSNNPTVASAFYVDYLNIYGIPQPQVAGTVFVTGKNSFSTDMSMVPAGTEKIIIGFTKAMKSQTFASASITLKKGGESIPFMGDFHSDSNQYAVTLEDPLEGLAEYTLSFGSGIKDLEGNSFEETVIVFTTMEAEFSIDSIQFKGDAHEDIDFLSEAGQSVSAVLHVTNNMEDDYQFDLIMALYENKTLVQASYETVTIQKQTQADDITVSISGLPEDMSGHEVRVYMWDSIMNKVSLRKYEKLD